MTEIGDYIEDLERPGAYGMITEKERLSWNAVQYQMDVANSNARWVDVCNHDGPHGWTTRLYRVIKPATLAHAAELAAYYDTITQ